MMIDGDSGSQVESPSWIGLCWALLLCLKTTKAFRKSLSSDSICISVSTRIVVLGSIQQIQHGHTVLSSNQ